MDQVGHSLKELWFALIGVFEALLDAVGPWWPLVLGLGAWIVFWTFAVNWRGLWDVLWSGGAIGIALIALLWILVWGVVAPPPGGHHFLFGLAVSNFVGKTVYVTALICIAALCGSVQLSGALPACCRYPAKEAEADAVTAHSLAHH